MKCSCCGWNLQGGTKKCPNCGSDISSQAFGGKPGAVLPVLAAAFSVLAVAAVLGVLFFSVLTESRESLSPPFVSPYPVPVRLPWSGVLCRLP